jgi:KDO2-lipid IV(A) lauroyltransferase
MAGVKPPPDPARDSRALDILYPPPPWRWDQRRALWRHWVRDPAWGLLDYSAHHLMRLLPSQAVSSIGATLGHHLGRRRPADRARALLRHLRPEAGNAEIERLLDAHWVHIGRCFAEFSAQYRFLSEDRIEIEGREVIDSLRQAGRPIIVAGLHVGNWEMVHLGLAKVGLPFHAIFQRLPNRFRMRIAFRMRNLGRRFADAPISNPILPTLDAAFHAHRLLADGHSALLYYVDEYWEGRVHAPRFGRAPKPDGNIMRAVRLAAHTGAAIVPCYALRIAEGPRFRLNFLPPVDVGPPGRGRQGMLDDMALLDAAIEPVVRAHPEQWFMLHAFRFDR